MAATKATIIKILGLQHRDLPQQHFSGIAIELEGAKYEVAVNNGQIYPEATRTISEKRAALAPEIMESFHTFSRAVFKKGALPEKTKQLIAMAVAHVTQCPYCIRDHTARTMRKGATREEIMEVIWVASEMRAGAAYAHAALAMDEMEKTKA